MRDLSDQEYDLICAHIRACVSNEQLQLELIDHCCCQLETTMDEHSDFHEEFKRSVNFLSPDGLHKIEAELIYVLQSKTQKTMKRILYVFGFLATFLTMAGQTMKMMRWPFANITQVSGAAALVVAMLVLIASVFMNADQYKANDKFRVLTGAFGGLLLGLGVAFKVQHIVSGGILFVSGMGILTLIFVPVFFWHLYKRELA
ncbi:MAG: hypothetical protein R2809_02845 [Flavobacteriales bacterium]